MSPSDGLFFRVTVQKTLLSLQQLNFSFKVTVHVTDDNDNAPQFQFDSPYKMTVMEDAPLGSRVSRLQAFDSDVGQNAVFEYAITHANIGKVLLFRPRIMITSKGLQIHFVSGDIAFYVLNQKKI